MGRRPGSRNRDYEQTRHALAARCAGALLRDDGEPAAVADLAATAGVSPTTLLHYFGDRHGLYEAAMDAVRDDSRVHLDLMADPRGQPPERTLTATLLGTVRTWRENDLGAVFSGSLARGIGSQQRGPAFLQGVLEPFVEALERLLTAHRDAGDLPDHDPRHIALALLSPVVVALLHQDALGGDTTRPLDVEAFARSHAGLVLAGLRSGAAPSA